MYNITDLMNTTNWIDYIVILDRESGYILGVTFLAITAIIFTLAFYKEGMTTAITASGFATTIVAIIMFGMGILAPHYIMLPLLLMAGGFIGKKLGGD